MRAFLKILMTLIPFLNGTFYILESVIKKGGFGIKIKEIRGRINIMKSVEGKNDKGNFNGKGTLNE